MAFKPKQLDPKATKSFSEMEVSTLLESIDDKLDLILEGQIGLQDSIKDLKTDHGQLNQRVERVEIRVDTIEARRR